MPIRTASLLVSLFLLLGGCQDSGSSATQPAPDLVTNTTGEDTDLLIENLGETCPQGEEQARMLQLVNEARSLPRQCGDLSYPAVAPLAWNCLLEQAALGHSLDMGDANFFSHIGSDGLGPDARVERVGYEWQALAENISAGYESVEATIQGWLDSPAHCANLMNASLTEMGLAYYRPTGADYSIYWTQKLARPR